MPHLQVSTLFRRLPREHPLFSEIESEFLKQSAGHYGENTVYHFLHYLPSDYLILKDLHLFDGHNHFQIDFLVISKNFLLIIEVKNFKGELIFDFDNSQLLRRLAETLEVFPDPFLQVEHQKIQLAQWLALYDFGNIPIYSFIAIANPNTKIETLGNQPCKKERLVRAKGLVSAVYNLSARFSKKFYSTNEMTQLSERLMAENTPYHVSLLKKYNLSIKDLTPGVLCKGCSCFTMERRRDHWCCKACGVKSKKAHLEALRDYQILFGSVVTSAEIKSFTGIHSDYHAKTILIENSAKIIGKTKDRKYVLKPLF
ncbi:nuclease-related domain-containing protein [Halobacillus massiliensis]|uniref:nuclease-related domain-containing protein n=1 Tax=Halobacillus massiliensis TaxID=1926286 RepID=UPI0009E46D37|nr:nuclease-related domain-containing protein [Halobacillus massiliensis]